MNRPTPLQKRPILIAYLLALIGLGTIPFLIQGKRLDQRSEAEALIDQLRKPINKVRMIGLVTPGGEIFEYSAPMNRLIAMGDGAREPLHRRLNDELVQNEVALILGEIGDERSVSLLIEAYPDPFALGEDADY